MAQKDINHEDGANGFRRDSECEDEVDGTALDSQFAKYEKLDKDSQKKRIVITKTYPTPSELHALLSSPPIVSSVLESELNIFHECVIKNRPDLFPIFFYTNLWGRVYQSPVKAIESEFYGLTAIDIAGKKIHIGLKKDIEKWNRQHEILESKPILMACLLGNVDLFYDLVKQDDSSLRTTDPEHISCLDIALGKGDKIMIEAVLKAETIKRSNIDRQLEICVETGGSETIQTLQNHFNLATAVSKSAKDSLVVKAIGLGEDNVLRALIHIGAEIPPIALSIAATYNQKTIAEILIREFHSKVDNSSTESKDKTCVHIAAERSCEEFFDSVFQPEHLNLLDTRRRSVLHSVAHGGSLNIFNTIRRKVGDGTFLGQQLGQRDGYLGSEQVFLVRGRDLGKPAWHYALVDRALLTIFREKTSGGAVDIAAYSKVLKSGWGTNPTQEEMKSVEGNYRPENVKSDAAEDMTPLHLAILKENWKVAEAMIPLVPDINVTDSFGLTPLHLACMRGNDTIISALEQRKADWQALDAKGRTPRIIAVKNGHRSEPAQGGQLQPSMKDLEEFRKNCLDSVRNSICREELEKRIDAGDDISVYIRNQLRLLDSHIQDFINTSGTFESRVQ